MRIHIWREFASLAVIIGLITVAPTWASGWTLGFDAQGGYPSLGSHLSIGAMPSARDGYDVLDTPLYVAQGPVRIATFHEQGANGWTGPSGFYSLDYRAALTELGETKTWRLYLWAEPETPPEVIRMSVWTGSNGLDNVEIRVTVVSVPEGLSNGPSPGTVFTLPPLGTLAYFPAYRTADGLEGYVLDVTATLVPEPSSLLALTGGMGLLAGVLRRRRG